jgi:hypothetical protein
MIYREIYKLQEILDKLELYKKKLLILIDEYGPDFVIDDIDSNLKNEIYGVIGHVDYMNRIASYDEQIKSRQDQLQELLGDDSDLTNLRNEEARLISEINRLSKNLETLKNQEHLSLIENKKKGCVYAALSFFKDRLQKLQEEIVWDKEFAETNPELREQLEKIDKYITEHVKEIY